MNKEQESLKVSLMLLEDKIIEIFCMSNDFYTFFDAMMEKHTLEEPSDRIFDMLNAIENGSKALAEIKKIEI